MKIVSRIFLTLIILAMLAAAACMLLVAWNIVPVGNVQAFVAILYASPVNSAILTVVGLLVILSCVVAVFGGSGGGRAAARQREEQSALVRASDIGSTYIALSAIDSMVQKHVRMNSRIKDCSTRVSVVNNDASIRLKMALMPDTNVVELTETLQRSLKEYIESLTGINVCEIHTLIDSMTGANNPKSRVD